MDGTVGRFTTVDPLSEKYYSWSPYSYCINNPLKFVDPDGRDSYLIIWATEKGKIGHAGFAIDNYKMEVMKDKNGNSILDKNGKDKIVMVPDGTVTYYDLWPGNEGGIGKENAGDNVEAHYNTKITTIDGIMTTDVTASEGYAPNGVIKIGTSYEMDQNTKVAMKDFMNSSNVYNGKERNCSDFAKVGVESSLQRKVNASKFLTFSNTTTPNALS